MSELSVEAQEALTSSRLTDLKKKINAGSWGENMELLMKGWGEKAAGLRFMHGASSGYWRSVSNNLTLYSIVATTVASAASLVAGSIDSAEIKDVVLFSAGGIGLLTSFIQSLKKFYNAEEKAAEHGAIAKQWGTYYRSITLQLGMSREDRRPSDELSEWALKEYERLQQEALPLRGADVTAYKKKFSGTQQALPDNCRDDFVIKVYGRTSSTIESVSLKVED